MGKIKALLSGVSTYPVNEYLPLPLCVNDVKAVKQALITGLNVAETDIKICGSNGFVTKKDILDGFDSIGSILNADDTLIFYFSGHGEEDKGKKYLAFSDCNHELKPLIAAIESSRAKNKIIILDCCYAGDFLLKDTQHLDFFDNIDAFLGHGCAVLASCSSAQTSGFEYNRKLSAYTSFVVDAISSRFLIRKGKKSLEAINEAIRHFSVIWNRKHPKNIQTPVFRSNVGGTIFFDVEDYNPYRVSTVYEETESYIIYHVEPVHTGMAKRLSAKVILRYLCSNDEIAEIANEVKEKIKYADIYQNAMAESRYRGKPANIVWCYFGYSEDDIIDGNYICHTTWVDSTQDKGHWYKEDKNSKVVKGICLQIHPSYEFLKEFLHNSTVSNEEIIEQTEVISSALINAAEKMIRLYREYINHVLSEDELFDAVEPLNNEIADLFFQQSDLPYPPKELHKWSHTHTELASIIHDFSLFYNRKHIGIWNSENRIHLMNSSISRYEEKLEMIRKIAIENSTATV